jgi:hypothetical protein
MVACGPARLTPCTTGAGHVGDLVFLAAPAVMGKSRRRDQRRGESGAQHQSHEHLLFFNIFLFCLGRLLAARRTRLGFRRPDEFERQLVLFAVQQHAHRAAILELAEQDLSASGF